jgi:hypothetical protein
VNSPPNSIVTFSFGAGTDKTAGGITIEAYEAKIRELGTYISRFPECSAKETLETYINTKPREVQWTGSAFVNDQLHGARCISGVEEGIKAFVDAGRTDIVPEIIYDHSLDIVGNTRDSANERVINAVFTVKSPAIP